MVRNAVAFGCGALFAVGLGIGGMTQPSRVLAFLDVGGEWDPRLAIVMLGAIATYAPAHRLAIRRQRPILATAFDLPTPRNVDARLVAGAALFGVGWGLGGLCPGPALTALASGEPAALVFVSAMLVGIAGARLVAGAGRRVQFAARRDSRAEEAS
jgi:uncharacterized membrane protein YedE/YeeE